MGAFSKRPLRRLIIAGLATVLLSSCGLAGRSANVAQGEKYQATGQYRAAYIEAKKVLQRDDKNAAAWVLLGRASLMLGNPKAALDELEHAKQAGAPASAWVVPKGRTLLVMGQYAKVIELLSPGPELSADDAVAAEILKGDAYRGLGKVAAASQAYGTALQQQPHAARALVGMAQLAVARHDFATAEKYVERAVAGSPDSAEAWSGKADVALVQDDYAGAIAAYKKALALKAVGRLPQDRYRSLSQLVVAQLRNGQPAQALVNVAELEKMAPSEPYPHYLHALALYQQGHLDDATTQLQEVLKAQSDNLPAQTLMGAVAYAKGSYGQAQMYLSNVLGAQADNTEARRLLALTYFREGQTDQALTTLRPTISGNPTDAELRAALEHAVATGTGVPGSSAAGAAAPGVANGLQGISLDARLAPAGAALAKGDAAQAIRLLQQVVVNGRPAEGQRAMLLSMAYARAKQPAQAVKVAAAYAAAHPDDGAAHQLYATALVADGQHAEAQAQYQQALKLDPKNLAARLSLGNLDALDRRYPAAAAQYQQILRQEPHNETALLALAQLSALQHDTAGAIKWYTQAIHVAPTSATPYLELVALYSRLGQFTQAAAAAKQMTAALPDNAAAQNAYGVAELGAGQHAAALPPLQQAVRLAPNEALYRINLARAQLLGKDTKDAAANLEAVLKADPAQVQATGLLAFMRLHEHDLPAALALAKGLQKQPTAHTAGLTLQGDLYMADKAAAPAAAAYAQAFAIAPTQPLVIKAYLASKAAHAKQPEALLTGWLAKHPDDVTVRLLLAQQYMDHARNDLAARQYELILKAQPDNLGALNNLAWIYTTQHDPKALALGERAHKLAPTAAGITDTYAWALVVNQQPKAAVPLLVAAVKAAPKGLTIRYHLAVAQARSGDSQGAKATLATLLGAGGDFPEKPAADKLYRELKAGPGHGK